MSALLARLFGRLPIGWLQLVHNRGRLAAAVAGVSFANILIFLQLGFLGALIESIALPYRQMAADVVISASDMNTLADGSPLPRSRMYEAFAVPGVAAATPLYYGKLDWKDPEGATRTLDVFGVDPAARTFDNPDIEGRLAELTMADTALLDRATRNAPPELFDAIDAGESYRFEGQGRTLTVVGAFTIGGGFSADGYAIVSDQTFLRLFPSRAAGAPNYILLRIEPGAATDEVVARLAATLPAYDSVARTLAATAARDQGYQTTQRPVGLIFGFGVAMGVIVGIIVVYQVLSTDVADHLREYATFKAIGYDQRFFLGIVLEEAIILALLGFLPAVPIALVIYAGVSAAASLPVEMTPLRPLCVLAGTVAMCALSGAIATRRLARADPADLF